jgi:demethylmenaquinone methyltransferase/2-methoxy-6-polyprenyl-1,4-benzoquinol methylase
MARPEARVRAAQAMAQRQRCELVASIEFSLVRVLRSLPEFSGAVSQAGCSGVRCLGGWGSCRGVVGVFGAWPGLGLGHLLDQRTGGTYVGADMGTPIIEIPAAAPVEALPPHPPLERYYKGAGEKRAFLTSIFDETASDYDKVERWLSLGSGRWYRRQALLRAGLVSGMRVADVAVGTGLVAREALGIVGGERGSETARQRDRGGDGEERARGETRGSVVGVDPSEGMLAQARAGLGIETVVATAEALPFGDGVFDFVSMGYALRHVEDLSGAFREFHRVLKPGGRVCVLEITRPRTRLGRAVLRAYLGTLSAVIGKFAKLRPRTPELWGYYWETIDRCVPPEKVLEALKGAGFEGVKRYVQGGVFSEYTGVR